VRIHNYLDAGDVLSAADASGATAIHPGYGFFSENYRFARRVAERARPMHFIGPSWRVIRDLGDKINTKRLARAPGRGPAHGAGQGQRGRRRHGH